jgi:hypothetical protein
LYTPSSFEEHVVVLLVHRAQSLAHQQKTEEKIMTIQYTAGSERKKLVAAVAGQIGAEATYAGMPTAQYDVGSYIISRESALTGPDNRDLIDALRQQGFLPTKETYDTEPSNKLTIEVPIGEDFTPEKMHNLTRLIASRETLLQKVLGTESLHVEQSGHSLKFPWFPLDGNAIVYGQLACALVRAAKEARRITARERPCESERFHMRTYLLKIGFIGDSYKQARKILTQGLGGNGSYAKADSIKTRK